MKRFILLLVCTLFTVYLSTAQKNRFLFSGDYSASHKYGINGAGYSILYNTHINSILKFETGLSFSLLNGTKERQSEKNNIKLLNLKSSCTSYQLYGAIGSCIPVVRQFEIEFIIGPIASYQTALLTTNDYILLDDAEDKRVSEVDVVEGLFAGIVGGARANLNLTPSLQLFGQFKIEKIFDAIPSNRSSVGIAYTW